MRLFFFSMLLILGSFKKLNAQDLVVTATGDSLNCNITQVDSNFIHYTYRTKDGNNKTVVPVSKIKYYQKGSYSTPELVITQTKIINVTSAEHLRIGIYGGLSKINARVNPNVPEAFKTYIEELKSGNHFGGDFTYFPAEKIGFGIKYSRFRTSNQIGIVKTLDPVTGKLSSGILKDDITIQFFAPTITARRSLLHNKAQFVCDFSLGYIAYKNNATVISNFKLTSQTLGLHLGLGFDFNIDNDISFCIGTSYTSGLLDHYYYEDENKTMTIKLDKNNLETISRLDLSIGIRITH